MWRILEQIRGYTFIELVVSLGLMAVLSSLALGTYSAWEAQTQRHFLKQFPQSIQLAKFAALAKHQSVKVCASEDQQTCSGRFRWDRYWIVRQGELVLAAYPLLKDHYIIFTAFPKSNSDHALCIEADGTTYNNGTFACYEDRPSDRLLKWQWVINDAARIYPKF